MFDPVAEAKRILAACGINTWKDKVTAEKKRLGRPLTLDELLMLAKDYTMNAEEIEKQRQSWARQMKD